MAGKIQGQSIIRKAWENSWKWLLGTKLGWVVAVLVGGIIGSVFAGVMGAIVAIGVTVGIVFIFHLVVAPAQIRKEARLKLIAANASYAQQVLGNLEKQRYQKVLDTMKSMIELESKTADSLVGKRQLTEQEMLLLQQRLSQQTRVQTLKLSEFIRIEQAGKVLDKIHQASNKMGFKMLGELPSVDQLGTLLAIRMTLDKFGIGLSNALKSDEYEELLKAFSLDVPAIDESTPDWILNLLVLPSSINNIYLLFDCMPTVQKQRLLKATNYDLTDFSIKRQVAFEQLVRYAQDSIDKM